MNRSGTPLLEASCLALEVGGRRLCGDLDLCLRAGECWALLGPNGAGKTTLLHTLAGLRAPDGGAVRLDGRPYADWRGPEAARFRGLLAQQQPDHFSATVLETVLVGRHPHLGRWGWEGAEDERIARAALDSVGLGGLAARDVLTLSGGERQRVAFAALLAQSPRVLLLDEPTNHLDLRYQIAILDLIRARADEGHGVVMALHDINLAARYADYIVLLDGQGGAQAGTHAEVLRAALLGKAFGHPLLCREIDGRPVFLPA